MVSERAFSLRQYTTHKHVRAVEAKTRQKEIAAVRVPKQTIAGNRSPRGSNPLTKKTELGPNYVRNRWSCVSAMPFSAVPQTRAVTLACHDLDIPIECYK